MRLLVNEGMRETINKLVVQEVPIGHVTIRLKELITPKLTEVNGCILANMGEESFDVGWALGAYGDRTGIEASLNKTHLLAFEVFQMFPREQLAVVAYSIAQSWACLLCAQFPEYVFHLLVAQEGDVNETSLTFYRYRCDEGPWLSEPLDLFSESLLLIEVP